MQAKFLFSLLIICGLCFSSLTPENKSQNITDAIKNGSVSCTYKANPESPHYVKPLLLTVKNRKNTPVSFRIEPGQQFFPSEEKYQNLIVTQENLITLKPNETRNVEVFAMCTEAGDAAPSKETVYKLASFAQGNLKKTADYIAKSKLNNITGQYAMWVVSDNRELEEVYGPDTAESRNLQKFLAKLTGKKLPPPSSVNNYANNYYAPPKPEVSYTGNFSMNIYKPASLTIALFNQHGVVVREMYTDPAVPAGEQKFTYAFDNSVYTDDFYWVKIMVDGEIKFNRKVQMTISDN